MNTNQIAHIASLVGEPARTAMLLELMDGRSLTARELAGAGRVSAQTASRHLARLVEAGLLQVQPRGRHRYHRLASPQVARMLEGLMQLAAAASPQRVVLPGPRDAQMRAARTCYDHLAGRLGVAIAERLLEEGALVFEGEAGRVTVRGHRALAKLGITQGHDEARGQAQSRTKRTYCRPCLDWSERRAHLAGQLGAMICTHALEQGWLQRRAGTRALQITRPGAAALSAWLGPSRWSAISV